MDYTPIIGMEVHVELNTKSKMFCDCKNDPNETTPNTHICPVCLAHPGTLPVPNRQAIIATVKIGKALGCSIRETSKFDRKHYFYPDLPKGYQISQYDEPIAEHGNITLDLELEENIRDHAPIGITRVHLEEDTAKLTHDAKGNTLVDFNRAGVPLVEIVTDPDFQSAAEAKMYCQELRTLFRALEVSNADMEKGLMRCEANVSVQKSGSFEIVDGAVIPHNGYTLNHKVEIKNLNSFKAVEKGILYEIDRQVALLEKGETWTQQTRGWDENKGETVLQREKENAQDYRYFPDPDIPPFTPNSIGADVRIPELPQAKRKRFKSEYGFSYSDARLLTQSTAWAHFTEAVMSEVVDWLSSLPEVKSATDEVMEEKKNHIAKLTGGWLTSKLLGALNDKSMTIEQFQTTPENFAELMALLYTNKVNATNAQKILLMMVASQHDIDPTHVLEQKGWGLVQDAATIGALVQDVINNHPKQVEEYKAGKEPILKFLVGMVMKASEGTANPKHAEEALKNALKD